MRFECIGSVGLAALAATGAALAAEASDSASNVPFQIIKGHIYVDGYVNGEGPYIFVFDTGASGMGRADVRLVAEQALEKAGQTENSDGINVAPIDVVKARSLRLGDVEKRNVELLSRDYNRNRKPDRPIIMGIFGADFFADHLLTIDYPARMLRFTRGSLDPRRPGVVAYQEGFAVPVCFASKCYTGKVDTGSSMTLVIPKTLVGQVATTEPVPAGTGTRANTVAQMYEMRLTEPVGISGVTATNLTIRYSDPSDDEINIGTNFLKDYVLTIDSRSRLLKIERPVSGERG